MTQAQAEAIVKPIEARFPEDDAIYNATSYTPFPSFSRAWLSNPPQAVAEDTRLSSWLLTKDALTGDRVRLRA
jgi:hypothetical protein